MYLSIHFGRESGSGSLNLAGAPVDFRVVGGVLYLQGSEYFWQSQAGLHVPSGRLHSFLAQAQHKFVRVGAGEPGYAAVHPWADRNAFLVSVLNRPAGDVFVLRPVAEIGSVPVLPVLDQDNGELLYAPLTGIPYPVRDESGGSIVDFSGWNEPYTVAAPASDQLVALPS